MGGIGEADETVCECVSLCSRAHGCICNGENLC